MNVAQAWTTTRALGALGRLRRALPSLATFALLLLWAAFLRPASLGGPVEYLVIRGNSMLPHYHTGDLVIVRGEPAYAIGDAVAYRVPAGDIGAGRTVIHRIIDGTAADGFVMQGDNNPSRDPWMPRHGDIVGKTWVVIPNFGRVLAFIHQPAAAGALAVSLLAGFMAARPRRKLIAVGEHAARPTS